MKFNPSNYFDKLVADSMALTLKIAPEFEVIEKDDPPCRTFQISHGYGIYTKAGELVERRVYIITVKMTDIGSLAVAMTGHGLKHRSCVFSTGSVPDHDKRRRIFMHIIELYLMSLKQQAY